MQYRNCERPVPQLLTGSTSRHAKRTAATAVARLRLETPGRMGIATWVGTAQQVRAEPAALGAERQQRTGRDPGRLETLAVGVQRQQRARRRRSNT